VRIDAMTSNQPPSVSLTMPNDGATFVAPATITVSAAASDVDGTVTRVDFYEGGTLVGSDTSSPFTIAWSDVAAGSDTLTAVATDDDGATTTSAPVTVTVTGGNQPPTVSLTAPEDGASYTAPATLTITADAADPDGTVARVDFYAGSTLIGSDTASPFTITWSDVSANSYTLTAAAADDEGATTTSAPVAVTVTAANHPPTVSLTGPAPGATYTAPATITIGADASDAEGDVSRVDFYNGATLIASDAVAPFTIDWQNVPAGSYSLMAVAVDTAGATTTSAPRTVTVDKPPAERRWNATFGASTDHDLLVNSICRRSSPPEPIRRRRRRSPRRLCSDRTAGRGNISGDGERGRTRRRLTQRADHVRALTRHRTA
jgi:hypothetical protein